MDDSRAPDLRGADLVAWVFPHFVVVFLLPQLAQFRLVVAVCAVRIAQICVAIGAAILGVVALVYAISRTAGVCRGRLAYGAKYR